MSGFEEDPAADFLTREQETIGDVLGGDDFAGENFELIADAPLAAPPALDQGLDFLEESPVAVPDTFTSTISEPEVISAPVMSESEFIQQPSAAPIYAALAEAAEPESIRKWRQEQAEQISARDAEAETKCAEWKAEAAKELENWHGKQNEVLAKTRSGNREAQEVFLAENTEQKPGQQWEKICKLCDFNPKNNRNCKDTSRMRSIFLQLKQNPLVRT